MDGRIKPQTTQQPMIIRQKSLPPHLLRNRPIRRIMQLVSRHLSTRSPPPRHRTGTLRGPETRILHVLCYTSNTLFQQRVLLQRILPRRRRPALRRAPKQQQILQFPLLVPSPTGILRRRRGRRTRTFLIVLGEDIANPKWRQRSSPFLSTTTRIRRVVTPFSPSLELVIILLLLIAVILSASLLDRCFERIEILLLVMMPRRKSFLEELRFTGRFRRFRRIDVVVFGELEARGWLERLDYAAVEEFIGCGEIRKGGSV